MIQDSLELFCEGVSRQRVCPGQNDLHRAVVYWNLTAAKLYLRFAMELSVIFGVSFQDLYHRFATAVPAVELYLRNCRGIVTFAVALYLRFAMELRVIFGVSFQDLYHRFVTAVELYLRYCCGISTFAVELYLRFAMELLVIFRASFQEDSPLEYPVFASTI